jgi:hypothetical protein
MLWVMWVHLSCKGLWWAYTWKFTVHMNLRWDNQFKSIQRISSQFSFGVHWIGFNWEFSLEQNIQWSFVTCCELLTWNRAPIWLFYLLLMVPMLVPYIYIYIISYFDLPITKYTYFETWEAPQHNSFYVKMQCLPFGSLI